MQKSIPVLQTNGEFGNRNELKFALNTFHLQQQTQLVCAVDTTKNSKNLHERVHSIYFNFLSQ